jgi:hypothetical protein
MGINVLARLAALITAVALAAGLGGCGGGGTSAVSTPQVQSGAPTGGNTSAEFVIVIPLAATASARSIRRPQYISPATQSLVIAPAVGGVAPTTVNLAPNLPNCSQPAGKPLTCTGSIAAIPGSSTYTLSTYDGLNGTGNLLSVATIVANIKVGIANVVPVTLGGVVNSVSIALRNSGPFYIGSSVSEPLVVNALDSDGNTIIGSANYSAPLTLVDTDPSNETKLSTLTFTKPTSAVSLTYNGKPMATGAVVSASGVPGTVTPATFLPIPPAPTGLASGSQTTSAISLKWTAVKYASSYNVYLNGALYAGLTGTSIMADGLAPGTAYSVTVTSVIGGVESAPSAAITVSTIAETIVLSPTGITFKGIAASPTDPSFDLSFSATQGPLSTGPFSADVTACQSGGSPFLALVSTTPTSPHGATIVLRPLAAGACNVVVSAQGATASLGAQVNSVTIVIQSRQHK